MDKDLVTKGDAFQQTAEELGERGFTTASNYFSGVASEIAALSRLAKDPYEKNNAAAQHPEVVARLRQRANELAATQQKSLLMQTEFDALRQLDACAVLGPRRAAARKWERAEVAPQRRDSNGRCRHADALPVDPVHRLHRDRRLGLWAQAQGALRARRPDSVRGEGQGALSSAAAVLAPVQTYKAIVELNEQSLRLPNGRLLDIAPGMAATVEIHQGTRSVMEYLLSPVQRVAMEAGRER